MAGYEHGRVKRMWWYKCGGVWTWWGMNMAGYNHDKGRCQMPPEGPKVLHRIKNFTMKCITRHLIAWNEIYFIIQVNTINFYTVKIIIEFLDTMQPKNYCPCRVGLNNGSSWATFNLNTSPCTDGKRSVVWGRILYASVGQNDFEGP